MYLAVIEQCYADIRESEHKLALDSLEPLEALHVLARQSFDYHEHNQEFTRLVLQENFQGGQMLGKSRALKNCAAQHLNRLSASWRVVWRRAFSAAASMRPMCII